MELVDGPPITDYCDHHQLNDWQRVRLLAAVCRGVQHAHQKQILHRDLKPSNLLVAEVDGEAVPKIIDFGIAKALGDEMVELTFTTGQRAIGTPHYMSPEALERDEYDDLDTRSDVYSIGVVLYDLLCGSRPFGHGADSKIPWLVQEILETVPPTPSERLTNLDHEQQIEVAHARRDEPASLRRRLSEDFDWIVMKAMASSRAERYGSAAEVADDLERVLADQPVQARHEPPAIAYASG